MEKNGKRQIQKVQANQMTRKVAGIIADRFGQSSTRVPDV